MSWPLVPASEIMVKRGGSLNPAKFPDETFELLSIPAFDKNKPEILKGAEIGSSKNCIEPRDVLLSKIVPHIRRCWVVPEKGGYRQIGSGEWIIFRDERFYPGFLKHYFTSELFHRQFMNTVAGVGGSLVRARPAGVERIEIPLPPLEEQKRIATILDKADAILRKRQQAIQLADEFLHAVFLDMFGDPVTNPKGFEIKELSDFFIDNKNGTKCGPFGSALKKQEYTESGIPVWSMDNISLSGDFHDVPALWVSEEKFEELNSYSVLPGDVIISRAGTVGKMGVVRSHYEKSLISTNLIRVRFNERRLIPEYFVSLMTYCKGRVGRLKTGPDGAFTHMNTGILSSLTFPYPPVDLQKRFMEYRRKVISILDSSLEYEHKGSFALQAISRKAFSGTL